MTDRALIRASDADRERTVQSLGDHLVAGRLELVEFDDRTAAAYAAQHLAALDRLVADLPKVQTAPQRVASRTLRLPAGVTQMAGPWASWALTAVICVTIWAATGVAQGELAGFWPGWVIGPWAAVLLSKTLGAATGRPMLCAGRR